MGTLEIVPDSPESTHSPALAGDDAGERDPFGRVLSALAGGPLDGEDAGDVLRVFKLIFANLTEALVVAEAGGTLILHNPASVALHGYRTMAEAIGPMNAVGTVWEVSDLDGKPLPPEQWPLARTLSGERFDDYQVRVRRTDTGKFFVGNYCGIPVRDRQGVLRYAFITIRDISEQKAAEAALRRRERELSELNDTLEQQVEEKTRALARSSEALLEARNRFFTLFHASPIPTQLIDLEDETILDVNSAYLNLFGLERGEVVGRASGDLAQELSVVEGEYARVSRLMQEQGQVVNVEMHLCDRAGEEQVLLVSVETAILDERPVAASTFIDITERKRTEEQVRRLAIELSRAQERERARIAQILHDDVQQMLVALQMQVELGASGDEGEMRRALTEAGAYAADILEMTRDLSVELSSPMPNTDRLLEGFDWIRTFMQNRYDFQVDFDGVDVRVPDPELRSFLLRLVRELLFNTVKHAGVDRASLRAWQDGSDVVVQVEDCGDGFDPNALQSSSHGTGYGLKSMAERVELLGGRFDLQAAPGAGTRATIALPVQSS